MKELSIGLNISFSKRLEVIATLLVCAILLSDFGTKPLCEKIKLIRFFYDNSFDTFLGIIINTWTLASDKLIRNATSSLKNTSG